MGINGSKGRASRLRAIRREREALARQHGIDPADRRAFSAFDRDGAVDHFLVDAWVHQVRQAAITRQRVLDYKQSRKT